MRDQVRVDTQDVERVDRVPEVAQVFGTLDLDLLYLVFDDLESESHEDRIKNNARREPVFEDVVAYAGQDSQVNNVQHSQHEEQKLEVEAHLQPELESPLETVDAELDTLVVEELERVGLVDEVEEVVGVLIGDQVAVRVHKVCVVLTIVLRIDLGF